MIDTLAREYRPWGIRLISLLLIVSFAFIPVRCDASAAPHSIFIAPGVMNETGGHPHHATGIAQGAVSKSVPHHSPVVDDSSAHQQCNRASIADRVSSTPDDSSQVHTLSLSGSADPASQQPVGGTLDMPPTSITPGSTTLQPLDTQTELLLFAPAAVLDGISTPPDALLQSILTVFTGEPHDGCALGGHLGRADSGRVSTGVVARTPCPRRSSD